ncbi:hypothetical protein T12_13475, partial [Trichinella patagoniensis]
LSIFHQIRFCTTFDQTFVTHPIDRASAERSFAEVLEVSKKLFPDYHDRKTTSFWKNNCKIGKQWKRSAFVAATGKLHLLMRLTISLDWGGNVNRGRKSWDVTLWANEHKRQKSQTTLKFISIMNHKACCSINGGSA